jgi:ribonucleotide reductase alpha subunit
MSHNEENLVKYSYNEVYNETLKYFDNDTLATDVWIKKYCLKDSEGNLYEKTPDDMHKRIAKELARIEAKYPNGLNEDEIYKTLKGFKYIIPGGGPMTGIGNNNQIISLSNCFVIGNEADSYSGILLADQELVQLAKRRGGVGMSVSHIRPKGFPVKNSALTSTGVVPFLERYSNSTREVAGSGRRGALMLSTSIRSMDAEDFIDAKMEKGKVTGANVSVKIDDDFMNCVINKTTYTQQFPVESNNPIITKEIDANKLWNKIIHNAWKSAEPGVFFWNTIIRESIPDCYQKFGFKTVSTNPCLGGDQKLLTIDGYKTFEELCNKEIKIINHAGNIVQSKIWKSGRKKTIKLINSNNDTIICTPDHKWMTINGEECMSKDLLNKQIMPFNYKSINLDKTPIITEIIDNGIIDVYDFIEPENHWGVVNGYVSHNCGEIPLNPYDSCRLLALNLYSYVENPFTGRAFFNYELFKKHVSFAMKFMDDIIDLELEKIDKIIEKIKSDPEDEDIKNVEYNLWYKIKEKAIQGRRCGLGITSEGDMLAALGLKYGTNEATEFAVSIHKILAVNAHKTSIFLAKDRGCFKVWEYELEKNNPFLNRIMNELSEEEIKIYKETGRRNIAALTIAPTGTVSIMTQTSSGIEPIFMINYKRRRKINPNDKDVKVAFTDETGDSWEEYNVFHHGFKKWAIINGYDINKLINMKDNELKEIIKQSPYYNATSNNINWIEKVNMQGKIQSWIDHSISATTNLPSDATEELVSKVYETAWLSGCKGMTIYRDGSRDGVLISNDNKEQSNKLDLKDNHAPKRPKRLKGDIMRFMNQSEKWIAVIGLLDNRPYELFTGMLTNGLAALPMNIKTCEIIKIKDENGNKRYDIEYIDNNNVKQTLTGLSHKFNPAFWNYAKMISGLLRHGMPLVKIFELIDSLNLDDTNLNTWKAGVMRILKKYIKDGEKLKGKCPECGSDNLEFKEGCLTCMQCGNSKCG